MLLPLQTPWSQNESFVSFIPVLFSFDAINSIHPLKKKNK